MHLEEFSWSNPIVMLYKDKKDSACSAFYNIYLDYEECFVFLTMIWDRLREDYRNFNEYLSFHDKIQEKAKNLPQGSWYQLSAEVRESSNLRHWELKLHLDYESFIIFSKILMDKLAKVSQCIIDSGRIPIPTNSFTDHKEHFIKK